MTEGTTARRTVLVGMAGAGALAACSSPPVPDAAAPNQQPGDVPSTATPATGATDAATGTGTATDTPAPPGGTPISEIPVGGGKIFPDQKVVVTQPVGGTLKAFSTTCTHQKCAVTMISDGHIICPCHGSAFDIESGAPTSDSEAKLPLEAKPIAVSGDRFTLT
jgi:nitrite reductase/ring-hydroxylating ferredoxin subunit